MANNKTKKDENSRPLILNLIVIIGYALLAYIMWPDIKDQIYNMRNYGVQGYAFVITCFFCFVVLIILFCFVDFLKRIIK